MLLMLSAAFVSLKLGALLPQTELDYMDGMDEISMRSPRGLPSSTRSEP